MTEAELVSLELSAALASCCCERVYGRQLFAEVRRLREALSQFAEHAYGADHRCCPKRLYSGPAVCTCGLDAALAGEG